MATPSSLPREYALFAQAAHNGTADKEVFIDQADFGHAHCSAMHAPGLSPPSWTVLQLPREA